MSLRIKILLPLLFLSAILLVYLYGYWMPHSLDNIEDEHRVSVERHIDSVAESMVPLLLAHQLDTIYENLDALLQRNSDWMSVHLADAAGRTMYPLPASPPAFQGRSGQDVHSIERQIDYLDRHLGKLMVRVDFAQKLLVTKKRHWELMTALLIILIGYVVTTGFILDLAARRPLTLLAGASQRLAKGDFTATLPKTGTDEVGSLVNSFRSMRDAIREYQAELKVVSSYNRRLIEASLDPLVTIDAGGKITDVNAATENVTGHDRDALIGTDFSDYFTDPEKAQAAYKEVFTEGFVRDYPLEIRHRDGHITYVLYNASVYRDESGKIIGVFAAARDITEQKKAEQTLRENEARLKEAQRIAHLGHWELDLGKNVLYWSDEVYRIFGLAPQEFGATYEAFLEYVHPDDRGYVNAAYTDSVRNKTGYDIEHRVLLKNGEVKHVNERCNTEYDDRGNPLRSIGTVLDITRLKRTEEELHRVNADLDIRVKQRTAELEKKIAEIEHLNKLFVGRELQMVELKEKIKHLEGRQ
jgi:PAS domain S-box-containing protein